jgi:phosphoribosyl 1,2-cyclic phosphodiesterase
VVVENDGQAPIVLDMGTGLRSFGAAYGRNRPIEASLLVTHLHWDHVQGLPFFAPMHHPNSRVRVIGPPDGNRSLYESFRGIMQPPYFPICCEELSCRLEMVTAWDEVLAVGDAKVMTRSVPHTGQTAGYRIEVGGAVIAYLPDHQECPHDRTEVSPSVLELCEGADLLIHDAQFTRAEFDERAHWGHCTPAFAVEVAAQAGVDTLALFHHDPWHDDDHLDALLAETCEEGSDRGVRSIVAASEGMVIALGGR